MNEQQINQSINDYLNQFNNEVTNDEIPTKKGFMRFMGVSENDLKGNFKHSRLLQRGLLKVNEFLEQGLYMKECNKLNKIMAELVNSFGYQY